MKLRKQMRNHEWELNIWIGNMKILEWEQIRELEQKTGGDHEKSGMGNWESENHGMGTR